MRCVWVEAWTGAGRIKGGLDKIRVVQLPVDRRLEGRSSWIKVVRERTDPPKTETKK
jgi:hypothetical protein